MTLLTWDDIGERFFETGVDHGVLYLPDATGDYVNGVAWNGLINVTESPTGAEPTKQYADNIPYLTLVSVEEFAATIEAYTYPVEFDPYNGMGSDPTNVPGLKIGQQPRKPFGFAYRTLVGNDLEGDSHGYKLHLVYNALAAPSERNFQTKNESPEAMTFSWELSTTPVTVAGYEPTSYLEIDSRDADPTKLAALEDTLYGAAAAPELPTPAEVVTALTVP